MATDDARCAASCVGERCACAPPRAPALTAVLTTGGLQLLPTGPGVLRLAPSAAARATFARVDLRAPPPPGLYGATWDDAVYHDVTEVTLAETSRDALGAWHFQPAELPRVVSPATGPSPELWRLQASLGARVAALLMGVGFAAPLEEE